MFLFFTFLLLNIINQNQEIENSTEESLQEFFDSLENDFYNEIQPLDIKIENVKILLLSDFHIGKIYDINETIPLLFKEIERLIKFEFPDYIFLLGDLVDGNCPNININEGPGTTSDGYGGAGYKTDSQGKKDLTTYSFLHGGVGVVMGFNSPSGNYEQSFGAFGGGGAGDNGGGGGGGYKGGNGGDPWNNKNDHPDQNPGGKGGDGGYSYSLKNSFISCNATNSGQGYVNIYMIKFITFQYESKFSNIDPILFTISLLCTSKRGES